MKPEERRDSVEAEVKVKCPDVGFQLQFRLQQQRYQYPSLSSHRRRLLPLPPSPPLVWSERELDLDLCVGMLHHKIFFVRNEKVHAYVSFPSLVDAQYAENLKNGGVCTNIY